MADFKTTLDLYFWLEHRNKASEVLHKNKGENGLTFYGIYQSAHPNLPLWKKINSYLKIEPDIKKCSVILSNVLELLIEVEKFYKEKFWDVAKLDKVKSQKIADEIFCFGCNTNMTIAVKKAQQLVGVKADGIVGNITLAALNSYDEDKFDVGYDGLEIDYYEGITKPSLQHFKPGWRNRALFVMVQQDVSYA